MSIQIQVDVSEVTPGLRTYPWIGERYGTIVLFSGEGVGTVLADKSTVSDDYPNDGTEAYEPGEHIDSWTESEFVEFEGTVTLSN